ncbi:hypothetical protein K488DRAFT_37811, partial [Vararia minispora EC-137]
RSLSQRFDMPTNPVFLEFPRTDAHPDRSTWPTNVTEVVDSMGHVNYYHPIGEDVGASLKWKHQIAMKVAEQLGMESGRNYVFKTWPEGYAFFDHHKGNKESPRHDAYLIGAPLVNRFRSVPEFVPHAIWLMTDTAMNRANCECKYCTKAPQRMISQKFGFALPPTSTPAPAASGAGRPKRARIPRERVQPYAVVQKIKKPVVHEAPPKQVAVLDRYSDIEALTTELGPERSTRRFFREAEMIWCALNPPIQGKDGQFIHFWPGIVREYTTKPEQLPREDFDTADLENPPQHPPPDKVAAQSYYFVSEEARPFRTIHRTLYRVQLLCVAHDYLVHDEECLPYPAYQPSVEILQALSTVMSTVDVDTLDRETLSHFNPCPSDAGTWDRERAHEHFIASVPVYSYALQAATSVASFWTPTDEFVYELLAREPSPAPPVPPAIGPTAEDPEQRALRSLGSTLVGPQPVPGRSFKQERYQGLWWGAERIWLDELVRLKPMRNQIAPTGAPNILPPSGPSRETLAVFGLGEDATEAERREFGAGERGVFMRLTSLYPVDAIGADGENRTDVLASGELYELADAGWEEPLPSAAPPAAPPVPATPPRPRVRSVEPERSPSKMSTGAPYMSPPGPPPGPGALPNPDPTVPPSTNGSEPPSAHDAGQTANGAEPSKAPETGTKTDPQVSGPPHTHPLPPAPAGFRFRPILTAGYEVVVSLTLVSGRYYPGLLRHPLLLPLHTQMREAAARDEHVPVECESVLALEGLRAGFRNAMDPHRWEARRTKMVAGAEEEVWPELLRAWRGRATAARQDGGGR